MSGEFVVVNGHLVLQNGENETRAKKEDLRLVGGQLVRFAADSSESIDLFLVRYEEVKAEDLGRKCVGSMEKITEILNQFVLIFSRHNDRQLIDLFLIHLGVFLTLTNVFVGLCSTLTYLAYLERFRKCKPNNNLKKMSDILSACHRFQDAKLTKMENVLLQISETMIRLSSYMAGDQLNVELTFLRLEEFVRLVKQNSVECEEQIDATYDKMRLAITQPHQKKVIIIASAIGGGFVGLILSGIASWFVGWFVALVAILLGTTGGAILGAVLGFVVAGRPETHLLEELVKCNNQKEFMKKNFQNFKQRLVNTNEFLSCIKQDRFLQTSEIDV